VTTSVPAGGRRWRFSVRPTPRTTRALTSIQLPAFWVLVGILFFSGMRLLDLLHSPFARFPAATTTAIILFALYAVPFWWFIASMDFLEREPPLLMATAFAWGALVATTTAMPGNRAMLALLAKLVSPDYTMAWGPAMVSPIIEELLKALGLVMIVLVARKQINSVLDGMVYGALIGLGFQVVENVFYALNAVEMANSGDKVGPVVATFFLRGFLAGLWSHTLFSAVAGAGVAWFLVRTDKSLLLRWAGLGVGFFLAWLVHFIWNSPLLADGLGKGGWGVLTGLLLKGIPALAMVMALLWVARHREANYYISYLVQLRDPDIATERELHTLGHGHLRADARRYGKDRAGKPGKKAIRGLQMAQAHLAVELSRAPNGLIAGDAILIHARDDVLLRRARMLKLGLTEAVASPLRPAVPRVIVLGIGAALFLCGLIWFGISAMNAA
jgi:RsiW-degrading membrane proteinase PrsW (M82 family)